MSRLTSSFPAKVTAVFLAVLLCYGLTLCGLDLIWAYDYGILVQEVSSYFETDDCLYQSQADAYRLCRVLAQYREDEPDQDQIAPDAHAPDEAEVVESESGEYILQPDPVYLREAACAAPEGYRAEDTNFRFAAYDTLTGDLYGNDPGLLCQLVGYLMEDRDRDFPSARVPLYYEQMRIDGQEPEPDAVSPSIRQLTNGSYVLYTGVAFPTLVRDVYAQSYRLFSLVKDSYPWAAVLLGGFLLAFFADVIFLCSAAGHRPGREEPVLNYQDRIPLDLYLPAVIFLAAMCVGMLDNFLSGNFLFNLAFGTALLTAAFLLCLSTLLTLCTRIKVGKWWRNTVTYQCCRLCWRVCRGTARWLVRMVGAVALAWRVALVCAALVVFDLFCASVGMYASVLLLFFAVNGGAALVLCSAAKQFHQLKQAGSAMAGGVFGQEIDTSRLYGDLRAHGENLNSLNQGMTIALDQKIRSERLKTELITNVSHDIKTPLTSIINYVDLLQKTQDEEQRRQYLLVLDRQAKRLKKLTEDLVEASKASTGNLPVNLAPTNLQEIIDQAIGEYEDRLTAARLQVVVTVPEQGLSAVADGRLLWRVLDNLLNNACKYAQADTRVYLDVYSQGDLAVISMKNISRQQLNLSPDELMERFVRGDSSRNTEGSGLGLNIAKSLVELQQGHFTLSIDGDLFKALISLPLLRRPELID